MMDELATFGSREYLLMFAVLIFARGMDFLSTWVATPNLVLEGNPIAKRLGWTWGIPVNLLLCLGFALWPLPAIVIGTTSILVAARNFQGAWLMRSMGEDAYRHWHIQRVRETPPLLFMSCLLAQTGLIALVGGAIVFFASWSNTILMGIGLGVISYASAVVFYSMLGLWRLRRESTQVARIKSKARSGNNGAGVGAPPELNFGSEEAPVSRN